MPFLLVFALILNILNKKLNVDCLSYYDNNSKNKILHKDKK